MSSDISVIFNKSGYGLFRYCSFPLCFCKRIINIDHGFVHHTILTRLKRQETSLINETIYMDFQNNSREKVCKLRKRKSRAAITSSAPNERTALVVRQHEISCLFFHFLQNAQQPDPYQLTLFRTTGGNPTHTMSVSYYRFSQNVNVTETLRKQT